LYKVVFTVVEVNEPENLDGEPTHISGPCKVYRVGDRITVIGNPGRLVLGRRTASASPPSAPSSHSPRHSAERSPSHGTTRTRSSTSAAQTRSAPSSSKWSAFPSSRARSPSA